MDYSEFLQRFYLPERGGALVGNKSKSKVVEFFFVNAMEEEAQEILPTSDSTYEKWLTGTRNPKSTIWAALINNFDFRKLQKALINTLNETTLRSVMASFCVAFEQGDAKEKHGMRYTQLRGLKKVKMQVYLTFACMNLKKLAKWKKIRAEITSFIEKTSNSFTFFKKISFQN